MINNKLIILILFFVGTTAIFAQYAKREDAIWAKVTNETITLDGLLNESSWAKAESLHVVYGESAGLPSSGWSQDPSGGPGAVTDPTDAIVKFLVTPDNYLYVGFQVSDSSVGGKNDWANWDGILMSIKARNTEGYLVNYEPTTPFEYFYSFWYDNDSFGPGDPPVFRGVYGSNDVFPGDSIAFNAKMFVNGVTNDSLPDNGYSVEMMINLDSVGVNVNNPDGDIIELNFSIWDKDVFQGRPLDSYTTRTWWQSPWNSNAFNVGRVYVNPNVTVDNTTVPEIEPEVIIPNAVNEPEPVIDGVLDEAVWTGAYTFQMAWDLSAVRDSYPGVGKYRSGRFQPERDLDGDGNVDPRATVLDPVTATIRAFFKDNFLYLSADVNDKLVQASTDYDFFDGVMFRIGDRGQLNGDNYTLFQHLTVIVNDNPDTPFVALDYLPKMLDSSNTEVALHLKGATTVNNSADVDEGYTIEMKVDLSYLGYPADLGDKLLFWAVLLFDGDSFDDPLQNYGTRTWWFGENYNWATAWSVMDPNTILVGVDDVNPVSLPDKLELYGNYPNPFNPSTKIKFVTPVTGNVNMTIYNVLGQKIKTISFGNLNAGLHEQLVNVSGLTSGIYFYSINLNSHLADKSYGSKIGKMILLK